jgi:hypothetical protein
MGPALRFRASAVGFRKSAVNLPFASPDGTKVLPRPQRLVLCIADRERIGIVRANPLRAGEKGKHNLLPSPE